MEQRTFDVTITARKGWVYTVKGVKAIAPHVAMNRARTQFERECRGEGVKNIVVVEVPAADVETDK